MISKEHQYIFVHIPKNAGTSIRVELKKVTTDKLLHTEWHYSLTDLVEKLGDDHAHYYKFAFSRNPYDRFVSAFTYNVSKMNDDDQEHWMMYGKAYRVLRNYVVGNEVEDFQKFVLSTDFHRVFSLSWPIHFKPQSHFINDGFHQLDFLGKVEKVQEGLNKVFNELGFKDKPQVKRLNPSKAAGYARFYTDEVKKRVASKYREDFEGLGYKP